MLSRLLAVFICLVAVFVPAAEAAKSRRIGSTPIHSKPIHSKASKSRAIQSSRPKSSVHKAHPQKRAHKMRSGSSVRPKTYRRRSRSA